MNLFEDAKKVKKTSAAKKDKLNVEIADAKFNKVLVEFVKLKAELASVEAKLATAHSAVKEVTKKAWVTEFSSSGKNPGSINVSSKDATVQFIPMDKYLTVDDERVTELREKFGEDIVSTDSTFKFNAKMLAKYGQVISDLITKSKKIADADKGKIIEKVEKNAVAKGTIHRALEFESAKPKVSIEEFLGEVQPIYSLKSERLNGSEEA